MAAEIQVDFAAQRYAPDGTPMFEVGSEVKGTIMILPDGDLRARGVMLWIGCEIYGRGKSGRIDLFGEQPIHEGDLQAGVAISAPFSAQLPDNGPLSYQGRYIRFEWQARLRIDIPIERDPRVDTPFLVVPRRV